MTSARWNLYLRLEHEAVPWPAGDLAALTAERLAGLSGLRADFLRYSPTDGTVDWVHAPQLPREAPVCHTALGIWHDADWLYVVVRAETPSEPIPELAACGDEDFSLVLATANPGRGYYLGLNQANEHIGLTKIWDRDFTVDLPEADGALTWPGLLPADRYAARVLRDDGGIWACFRVSRALPGIAMADGSLRVSVGRTCYATGEWLAWGSPIIWSPRADAHGAVRCVETPSAAPPATLERLDLLHDAAAETATIETRWSGVGAADLQPFLTGNWADFADKLSISLDGQEQTKALAESVSADFALPAGRHSLEILSAPNPVRQISLAVVSSHALQVAPHVPEMTMPERDELSRAFAAWHERQEANYAGGGLWRRTQSARPCLCHAGVFNTEPYLLGRGSLDWQPVYDERVRETCARMLADQRPAGWFPCYCSALKADDPKLGDGGAFTNGSVGESLALAGQLYSEPDWLAAARRAADYSWYRWENNQNYAAFVLWHLAALQAAEPRDQWLETALYYARNFVSRDIGPSGAQSGHNYFTGYGTITLKGLALCLAMLPADHEYRPALRRCTIRFANQILSRQQADGLFAGRNRKYLGYQHTVAGLFHLWDALPDQRDALRPALAAMTHAAIAATTGGHEPGLVIAQAARL